RATGDDPGSLGGGLQQHPAGAEVTEHLMRDGVALERDAEEVLLRVLAALADRLGDLVGLAQAHAHVAVAVAHDDEGREADPPAALHHLGHAVDVDHAIAEIEVVGIDRSRHSRLAFPRTRGRPRGPPPPRPRCGPGTGNRFDRTPPGSRWPPSPSPPPASRRAWRLPSCRPRPSP